MSVSRGTALPWGVAAIVALATAGSAHAEDVTWMGTDNGNWNTPAAWSTFSLPVNFFDQEAHINNGNTVIVNSAITGDNAPAGVVLGLAAANTGGLAINAGGNFETITGPTETGSATIGGAGTGTVNVNSGGQFRPANIVIGNAASGIGTVNVNNGGTINTPHGLQVGQLGRGTLNVLGGGNVTAAWLNSGGAGGATPSTIVLGDTSGLTATVNINGPTSLLRTTQVTGQNVNFTSTGALTLPGTHTLVADIRHGTNHGVLKSNSTASVAGALRLQFTGVTPALGNAWNLVEGTSISGNFGSINATAAPALPAGQAYQTRKVAGGVGQRLQVVVEQMLTLEVNRQTGALRIKNTGAAVGAADVSIDGYTVISANGGLSAGATWNSLADQAVAGWQEAPTAPNSLSELNTTGATLVAGGQARVLGTPYTPVYPAFQAESDDVSFSYTTANGVRQGLIEYTGAKLANNLVVIVNPTTGAATLKNESPFNVSIEGYSILSASGALRPANGQWNSLSDQGTPNWTEAAPTPNALSELAISGSLAVNANSTRNLGNLFTPGGTQDLAFEFLLLNGADSVNGVVRFEGGGGGLSADFNDSGNVNGADLAIWRANYGAGNANGDADGDGDSDGNDFLIWQRQNGMSGSTASAAAVPEPAAWLLSAVAGTLLLGASRRKNRQAPKSETHERSVGMIKTQRAGARRSWLLGLVLAIGLVAGGRAQAADILFVGAQLDSSDTELVTLLKGFGHTIVNEGNYGTPAGQFFNGVPTAAQLANVDLILFSRTAVSTEYDDAGEPAAWNTLAKPLLLMNSALVRGGSTTLADNRWGWMNATGIVSGAASPTDFDFYPNPSHPFVNGRTTNVFPGFQTMDYINSMDVVPGSTMVATLTVTGIPTPGILDIPAGTTLFTDTQGTVSVTGGRRVFFQMYEYPDTTDVFAVSTNGGQIINQIINVMTSNAPSIRAGDVDGDGDVDIDDFNTIKTNFRTAATLRSQGDLNGDGFVDLSDFRIWKENDPLAGVGAVISIPEPASAVTALVGALGFAALRRKRRTARSRLADDVAAEFSTSATSATRRGGRLVPLSLAAALVAAAGQPASAYNIAWVSFHAADNTPSAPAATAGFTMAPDVGYTQLLTSAGHTVTRFVTVNDLDSAANQAIRDSLNAPGIDLVIVARGIDSGHYQTANEATAWNNTIQKPMMHMGGYAIRNTRLGFVADDVLPDTSQAVKLTAAVPGHAVFAGIALDGTNTMVDNFSTDLVVVNNGTINATQRGISVNSIATPIDAAGAGGTLIATVAAGNGTGSGNLVIAEWTAGTTITKDTGPQTLSKHRMVFLSGSREHDGAPTTNIAGIFDLTPTGETMFKNAVNYLGGFSLKPGDVNLDGVVNITDFNVIRDNFQKTVASRALGDLTGDGFVDWKDYRQWKDFREAGVPAGSFVPEPAAGALAATALIALARRRRIAA